MIENMSRTSNFFNPAAINSRRKYEEVKVMMQIRNNWIFSNEIIPGYMLYILKEKTRKS